MMLKKAVTAASGILFCTQLATASTFDNFFAFGDSTIDSGWFANASTGTFVPGISPPFSPFDTSIAASIANGGNAHFTGPGPNWTQLVAGSFGLTANPANTPGGTNYAIGGAYDFQGGSNHFFFAPSTTSGNFVFSPALPGTVTQIGNYLASVGGKADPKSLYVISSGGNDFLYASSLSLAAAKTYLQSEAATLANSIATLQKDGAHHILISNEYPLLSFTKTDFLLTGMLFNALKNDLRADVVHYILADTFSLISQVEKNPLKYGITALTSNAAAPPGFLAGLTGYGVTVAPTTTPSSSPFGYGNLVSSDALMTHLFMDGVHLTEAGEIITADFIEGLLAPPNPRGFGVNSDFVASMSTDPLAAATPRAITPIPTSLPLFATGLGALGLVGWRRKRKSTATAIGA